MQQRFCVFVVKNLLNAVTNERAFIKINHETANKAFTQKKG